MKRALAILAAVFSVTATAAPVQQATHLWTTNKINEIVGTNTAAKIACATNAVLAAVQDKYLPLDGSGRIEGIKVGGEDEVCNIYVGTYGLVFRNFMGDWNEHFTFWQPSVGVSELYPDGSPVATSNMVERMADVRYAPTSTAVTVASHASQLSRLSQSLDTKIDAPSATNVVASASVTNAGAVAAAAASAASTYLPLSGGIMTGGTYIKEECIYFMDGDEDILFWICANGNGDLNIFNGLTEFESAIITDGSPVATSNMVGRMIAAIPVGTDTNAVKDIAASASVTNAGAVAEAAASAAAAYLPLSGGRLTGSLITRDAYIMDDFIYFMDGDENILFWIYANRNGDLTVSNLYGDESAIAPDDSPVATSNMVERMADYALTGGAVLKSGEIAAIETATNLTLRLDFGDNGRGADCAAYVENLAASNVMIRIGEGFHVACAGDAPLTLPKASTNLVWFCRVKTNVVVVSRQEVK